MVCSRKGCNKKAVIIVDGLIFCEPHYEEYFQGQSKAELNWDLFRDEDYD